MLDVAKILNDEDAEYIYGALGIADHGAASTHPMRFWFNHLRENALKIKGDIFEFGVYKGKTLLSIAILLKRLGSDKTVYGFDSFGGFPNYSPYDDLANFTSERFDPEILKRVETLKQIRSAFLDKVDVSTISTSGDFSDCSKEALQKRIDTLGLDNIVLIEGDFAKSVPEFFKNYDGSVFSANIDCDLYDGYKACLPYIWDGLEKGGYVHLDEYYSLKFAGARIACDEIFQEHGITPHKQESVPPREFERWYFTK